MEWHIKCDAKDIARYVFCPGDQARAKKIVEHFDTCHLVTEDRGYIVYSGESKGVPMTVIGTGMGGLWWPSGWKNWRTWAPCTLLMAPTDCQA